MRNVTERCTVQQEHVPLSLFLRNGLAAPMPLRIHDEASFYRQQNIGDRIDVSMPNMMAL